MQYKRALKLIDQILKFESKEIKLLHNDIAAQLEEIAFIYEKKALLNEAKEIYLIILSLYTNKTNQITLSRQRILNRVGDIYYKQGFYKLAEEIYSENIKTRKSRSTIRQIIEHSDPEHGIDSDLREGVRALRHDFAAERRLRGLREAPSDSQSGTP